MEDQDKDMQQEAQQDAEKKTAVPTEVTTSEFTQDEANDERKKHFDMLEKGKEMAKKYGEPDMQSLLAKVGSDGIFAQRIVEDFVMGGDNGMKSAMHPDSPQENNITGRVDHTEPVAKKLAVEGQTDLAPVVK